MELHRELPDAFFSWKILSVSVALAIVLVPRLERALDRWLPGSLAPGRPSASGLAPGWDARTMWR